MRDWWNEDKVLWCLLGVSVVSLVWIIKGLCE